MTTNAYPKMTQAQALISLYCTLSNKSKEEFKDWFFENEEPAVDAEEVFIKKFSDAVKIAKDFKEGNASFITMEELMNEL